MVIWNNLFSQLPSLFPFSWGSLNSLLCYKHMQTTVDVSLKMTFSCCLFQKHTNSHHSTSLITYCKNVCVTVNFWKLKKMFKHLIYTDLPSCWQGWREPSPLCWLQTQRFYCEAQIRSLTWQTPCSPGINVYIRCCLLWPLVGLLAALWVLNTERVGGRREGGRAPPLTSGAGRCSLAVA